MVTHDMSEALLLADRIAVLHQGRLRQLGTPKEIYDEPADTFVAGFIGTPPMNFLERDQVTVDIGYKSEGQIPIREFSERGVTPTITVGDEVDVYFESDDGDTGIGVFYEKDY